MTGGSGSGDVDTEAPSTFDAGSTFDPKDGTSTDGSAPGRPVLITDGSDGSARAVTTDGMLMPEGMLTTNGEFPD